MSDIYEVMYPHRRELNEARARIVELEAALRDYTQAAGAEAAEVDRRGARIAELEAREKRVLRVVSEFCEEWQITGDETYDALRALLDDEREEPGDG